MSQRKLVRLRDRYPTVSRSTLWRMRNEPDFPNAVVVLNTEYFYEHELETHEESRRRVKQRATTAATTA
jgi:hypothetical protein